MSDVEQAIDALHRSGRLTGAALYAFGHTAATERLRRRLERHDLRLTAVLDNNPAKQGGALGGVPVLPPAAVTEAGRRSLTLIASRFHAQMRDQLQALGYAGEIVRVGEASIATAGDGARGARRLGRLRLAHPDRHLLVCPFDALGDVYWALAYLPAFLAARRLAPAVPVVVGARCRQVAELFEHAQVEQLTQAEMDDLVAAVTSAPAPDATIAHHDRPWSASAPVRVLDERFVAFTDLYRDIVYGLGGEARPRAPRRPDPAVPADVDGLPRGRTVLLAPHARSVVPVDPAFWERTAAEQASQGRAVATVVHGDEPAVAGTTAVRIGIPQLLGAVEHAGTFIALRSGLCDLAHSARARKVHVTPDACYSDTRHRVADFFALPGWEPLSLPVS